MSGQEQPGPGALDWPTSFSRGVWGKQLFVILGSLFFLAAIYAPNAMGRFLIPPHSDWTYHATDSLTGNGWTTTGFDDSAWPSGPAGFGYGDDDDSTVLEAMRGRLPYLQIRHRFLVVDAASLSELFLYIRYDDGFVAYLNGIEFARAGVTQRFGSVSVQDHEAEDFELFTIANAETLIKDGWNVLAVHGFNRSLKSSDFTLDPVLTSSEVEHPGIPLVLTRQQALEDLHYLETRMQDQSSYLRRDLFDYKKAFGSLRATIPPAIETARFNSHLRKIIAAIGDAHAEVTPVDIDANHRFLPIIVADSKQGVVALAPDQSGFLDHLHPVLAGIDGQPLSVWLDTAAKLVSHGSPQMIRYESLLELRSIDRLRAELGLPNLPQVRLTLKSFDGRRDATKVLDTLPERESRARLPLRKSAVLGGNIGYLRIRRMSDSGVDDVLAAMEDFRNSNGLIIDVRDNRGGSYDILRALYGYFLPEGASPYVANIAAYRLSSRFEIDHLDYRPTYRLSYAGWDARQRQAILNALSIFTPEWTPPEGLFSEWHFMLLDRTSDPGQYYYPKPVAVLSNAASFSATDGFLSAFGELPQVALIGQASSGGSGATQRFQLPNSGLDVKLSSMASFRSNGKLFDGNGIAVDIPVSADATDFIGESDVVLDKAIEWVKDRRTSMDNN